MMKKTSAKVLRTAADAELGRHTPEASSTLSAAGLLHELQVHQIELEMQNATLREAHAALEASRDCYVDLYEFAPVGYLTLTPAQVIAEANLTTATLLGIDRKHLLGQRFDRFVTTVDRDRWNRHFIGVVGNAGANGCDLDLVSHGGSAAEAHVDCRRTRSDRDAFSVRVALTDITARKRSEESLRRSEERLRFALGAAKGGWFDLDLTTGDAIVSPEYARLLGYECEEYRAGMRVWLDNIHPEDRAGVTRAFDAGLAKGENVDVVYRRRVKSGHWLWLNSVGSVVEWDADGKPARMAGVHTDITERKQAEVALQAAKLVADAASRAKTQFLAHMSHEIRTPMNVIVGLIQVLEREPATPEQTEIVRNIHAAGDSLLRIIDDVLDFSKIEAGQLRMEARPFELPTVLDRAARLLRGAADAKGVRLEIEPLAGQFPRIVGDALRLEQVLVNLISNAIKFADHGSVVVEVKQAEATATGLRLRFEVVDTGIGIEPEVLGRLFAPFTQADTGITRQFGGTGLGLAISKALVVQMGGRLGATSTMGAGSTFWFEVPFQCAGAEVGAPPAAKEAAIRAATRDFVGLRVLVVDDNRMNRFVVERMLAPTGASVVAAADGQQALQLLKAQPAGFDVVLMDVQMPVMDGLTATRVIRGDPELCAIPVIALTAGVLAEEREAAMAAGVDGFLAKPLDLEELTRVLTPYVPS
jgi:PAS domain S-box-containing protein